MKKENQKMVGGLGEQVQLHKWVVRVTQKTVILMQVCPMGKKLQKYVWMNHTLFSKESIIMLCLTKLFLERVWTYKESKTWIEKMSCKTIKGLLIFKASSGKQ